MLNTDDFLERLYHHTVSRPASNMYDTKWQEHTKTKFEHLIGRFPYPEDHSLNPKIVEKTEKDEYWRLKVEITTIDNLRCPTYVLIPKKKKTATLPAVLALHGHGYGNKEIVGLNHDGTEIEGAPGIHNNCAIDLVLKGMVVVAPELFGFGDRKLARDAKSDDPSQNSCFSIASQLLLMGKTIAGLRVFECRRVIDYIQTMDTVDHEKIGCIGFSGGGLVAAFTSIVDERIKATVLTGYTNTFKGSIMDRNHCLDNYIPGILQLGEMPELLGAITPRPLFIESGIHDTVFPIAHAKEALETITDIYRSYNAENQIAHHFFNGKHEICGDKSYNWLYHNLMSCE
ncbi:dienelactone hydrolase family protein [Metabacillus halosaccharovorans]|uniref:dienelactone hydrolase family protein n=1 Tax=Metabacillus halosaccharovorans TaxID=930124 RepID=UPI001C1FC484|nr:alpha/beta hydrolase family protein [Metabacillus halosaccharovorans]MBU7595581.1 dienelactone hydrolase family protein [Metabacillus halosaccharovorans]